MPKTEDLWYVVPEIEVKVHQSWVNLIIYCQHSISYGTIRIRIRDAQPIARLKEIPDIRFDKPEYKEQGKYYLIQSLDLRVSEYWINLIQWCQDYFQSGDIEFKLIGSQPTELLGASQKVRFDKPETIPTGIPLDFGLDK